MFSILILNFLITIFNFFFIIKIIFEKLGFTVFQDMVLII